MEKAIQYVKETEDAVDILRQEIQGEIDRIEAEKEKAVNNRKSELQEEVLLLKEERSEYYKEELEKYRKEQERVIAEEKQRFEETYNDKSDELALLVVKGVLEKYGSSKDEEANRSVQ